MSATITGPEVAEVLRRAIRGEIPVTLENSAHKWAFANCDVGFKFGPDWHIVFFNDAGDLDYCNDAVHGDRTGDFDSWYDAKSEPVSLLDHSEQVALERLLEAAR